MVKLNNDFWTWVEKHLNDDPLKLRLKYAGIKDEIDYDAAIRQIECRRRFGKKLNYTLWRAPHFYFPSKLSGEQSTSDLLANFHAQLIHESRPMADLTAGLGVDVIHCCSRTKRAVAIERSKDLAKALDYNTKQLGCDNVEIVCEDCRNVIEKMSDDEFGTIFIDPARRGNSGERLFSLNDCEPDVTSMLPTLSKKCDRLVIKMSPMLDISHTLESIGNCSRIISLGTTTECKELISVTDFNNPIAEPTIEGITVIGDQVVRFEYLGSAEQMCENIEMSRPQPGDYFYEPYPSVMKLNANKLLATRYELKGFHPNTRLYHSSICVDGFPGEVFKIVELIEFSSKYLKRLKGRYPVLNVTTRNFGMSAEELKKKLGVREGGEMRLIGLTDNHGKRLMMIVEKA